MIRQYLAPGGYVVSLQNCMNEATIAEVVGRGKTMGCIASNIGVGGERWSKLVASTLANGVSVCTGLPGAQIAQNEAIRHFQARLGSEAIRIGQARGYRPEEIDHLPPGTIARAGEGDAAALKTYDERRLSRVGRGSLDQRPSMGQDMAKGRRTEIEYQRLCRARRRAGRDPGPRQRAPRRHRQARRARRTKAGPAPHHRAAAQLTPASHNSQPLARIVTSPSPSFEARGSFEQRRVHITPVRILLFDQPNLPIPTPLLERLFARNRVCRIVIALEPNQAIDAVSSAEPCTSHDLC